MQSATLILIYRLWECSEGSHTMQSLVRFFPHRGRWSPCAQRPPVPNGGTVSSCAQPMWPHRNRKRGSCSTAFLFASTWPGVQTPLRHLLSCGRSSVQQTMITSSSFPFLPSLFLPPSTCFSLPHIHAESFKKFSFIYLMCMRASPVCRYVDRMHAVPGKARGACWNL